VLKNSSAANDVVERLAERRREICQTNARETGYSETEVASLYDALLRFATKLPELMRLHCDLLGLETSRLQRFNPGVRLAHAPHGRSLIVVPSNAAVPLAAVLPLAYAAAGNQVDVTCNSAVRETTKLLTGIVAEAAPGRVRFREEPARTLVAKALDARNIECLHFTGGSAAFPDLSRRCAEAGVKLIFEGEGRSAAVLLPTDALERVASAIETVVESKRAFAGRMCSAPNILAVHQRNLETAVAALARAGGLVCNADQVAAIRRNPTFVPIAALSEAFEREWFSPACFLLAYEDVGDLLSALSEVPYRLQLALFGDDLALLDQAVAGTRFPRYCHNMLPSAQDPLLPWGNDGRSGQSDLLDFYRKGLRRVVVESWA
jgi:acyl-CoA reductase-like NAD-dependent aldehyde dehydrogenase